MKEADKRGLDAEYRPSGRQSSICRCLTTSRARAGQIHAGELQRRAAAHGVPVDTINMMDYGMQRGDKVLGCPLSLIG